MTPILEKSFRRLALSLVAGGAACFLYTPDCQAQRGAPIEFSTPNLGQTASNLNNIGSSSLDRRKLDEELFRPFEPITPRSSVGGVLTPVLRPPAPAPTVLNKKAREQLDQRRNWAFVDPEGIGKGPSAEEIFGLREYNKDGTEKKAHSTIEQFYKSFDRSREDSPNRLIENIGAKGESDRLDPFGSTSPQDPLAGIRHPDMQGSSPLASLLESGSRESLIPRQNSATPSPFAGLGSAEGISQERFSAHRDRLDNFKHLLDSRSSLPVFGSTDSAGAKPGTLGQLSRPASGLDAFTPSPVNRDALPGLQAPATPFSRPSIPTALAPAPLSPSSLAPTLQPPSANPNRFPTQPPILDIPRRKL